MENVLKSNIFVDTILLPLCKKNVNMKIKGLLFSALLLLTQLLYAQTDFRRKNVRV